MCGRCWEEVCICVCVLWCTIVWVSAPCLMYFVRHGSEFVECRTHRFCPVIPWLRLHRSLCSRLSGQRVTLVTERATVLTVPVIALFLITEVIKQAWKLHVLHSSSGALVKLWWFSWVWIVKMFISLDHQPGSSACFSLKVELHEWLVTLCVYSSVFPYAFVSVCTVCVCVCVRASMCVTWSLAISLCVSNGPCFIGPLLNRLYE